MKKTPSPGAQKYEVFCVRIVKQIHWMAKASPFSRRWFLIVYGPGWKTFKHFSKTVSLILDCSFLEASHLPAMYDGWDVSVTILFPRLSRGRHEPNKQGHVWYGTLLPRGESKVRDFTGSCYVLREFKGIQVLINICKSRCGFLRWCKGVKFHNFASLDNQKLLLAPDQNRLLTKLLHKLYAWRQVWPSV